MCIRDRVRRRVKGFFTQEFVVYERDFFYWTPHSIPAVSADILTNSWVEKLKRRERVFNCPKNYNVKKPKSLT